jgi:hypothetical protein
MFSTQSEHRIPICKGLSSLKRMIFERIENILGKAESAGYENLHLFQFNFSF